MESRRDDADGLRVRPCSGRKGIAPRRCLRREFEPAGFVTSSRVTEWELWAVAHRYVEKHGRDAPILAAMRSDELLAKGELEGARTFLAVVRKIEQLLAVPEGPLH